MGCKRGGYAPSHARTLGADGERRGLLFVVEGILHAAPDLVAVLYSTLIVLYSQLVRVGGSVTDKSDVRKIG